MTRLAPSVRAVVLLLAVAGTAMGFDTFTSLHPACTAPCLLEEKIRPSFTMDVDPSLCADPSQPCPRCLLDNTTWRTVLTDFLKRGAADRHREGPVHLLWDNWLSSAVSTQIAHILLTEAMNVSVVPVAAPWDEREVLCCSPTLLSFESWTDPFDNDETANLVLRRLPTGYSGKSSWYVAGAVVDQYPLLKTFEALKMPAFLRLFPPAFSTPCQMLQSDKTVTTNCSGPTVCDIAVRDGFWRQTQCVRGRYVPPQCQGPDREIYCREAIHADPGWDVSKFEGMILNNKLNLTIAYVGAYDLTAYIANATRHGVPMLYYGYEPDPGMASLRSEPIVFPRPTMECTRAFDPDPVANTAGCDYAKLVLAKVMRRLDVGRHQDVGHFFASFQLSDAQIAEFLNNHTSGGGASNASAIACKWVRDNLDVWKEWIKNTPPAEALLDTSHARSNTSLTILVGAATGGGVSCLVLLVLIYAWHRRDHHHPRDLSRAPTNEDEPFTIVFTDIQSSTKLWARDPFAMGLAIDTHHALIRSLLRSHGGYEVKTIGDSFMLAFRCVPSAVAFALAMQVAFHEMPFDPMIDDVYRREKQRSTGAITSVVSDGPLSFLLPLPGHTNADDDAVDDGAPANSPAPVSLQLQGNPLSPAAAPCDAAFKGMRVRVAVHCGRGRIQQDPVTGGYDYYGTVVNTAARVEAMAHGGQVLLTDDAMVALQRAAIIGTGGGGAAADAPSAAYGTHHTCLGPQTLRGLPEAIVLHQLLPPQLADRQFPPLRVDVEQRGGGSGGASETTSLDGSSSHHNPSTYHHHHHHVAGAEPSLFGSLPTPNGGGSPGAAEDTDTAMLVHCTDVCRSHSTTGSVALHSGGSCSAAASPHAILPFAKFLALLVAPAHATQQREMLHRAAQFWRITPEPAAKVGGEAGSHARLAALLAFRIFPMLQLTLTQSAHDGFEAGLLPHQHQEHETELLSRHELRSQNSRHDALFTPGVRSLDRRPSSPDGVLER